MFEKNVNYKIRLSDDFFYTGYVLEEDSTHIKFYTVRNETIIFSKEDIKKAEELYRIEEDKNGNEKTKYV